MTDKKFLVRLKIHFWTKNLQVPVINVNQVAINIINIAGY